MLDHWQAELILESLAEGSRGPRAGVSLLVGRAKAQGFLGLVLAHWWVEPYPGNSGCRALRVLELVLAC